ncbi:MAG: hypothetical protein ABI723_00780 [Bacteroidia bacterium]
MISLTTRVVVNKKRNFLIKVPDVLPEGTYQVISIFAEEGNNSELPVSYSKNPDALALAGIWKNKKITQTELRKKAWGNRI